MRLANRRVGRFCGFRLSLLLQVDGAGRFTLAEGQVGAELVRERPHRLIAIARRDTQAFIAAPFRFRDQSPKQYASDALAADRTLYAECDLGHAVDGGIGLM